MKLKEFTLFFLLLFFGILTLNLVLADGGVIGIDKYSQIYLPSQKAAIFWEDGKETLILSTKIQTDNITNMAWLIPIPSKTKPEVEKGDIEIFFKLASLFEPEKKGVDLLTLSVFLSPGILFLILGLVLRKHKTLSTVLKVLSILFLIGGFLVFFYLVWLSGMYGFGPAERGVEPIEIKKVDIYDIAILKATNATVLVDWLNENGYIISNNATSILQEYCDKENFYFIANKINLANKYNDPYDIARVTAELKKGIATPLKITFQPESPFYPLKLSSINEGYTNIIVYVISDRPYFSNILYPYFFGKPFRYSPEFGVVTLLRYGGSLKELKEDAFFFEG